MEIVAYSTVAMTLGLVVARPRVTPKWRLSPAMAAFAGVLVLLVVGIVHPEHFSRAILNLWSPFVAIAAIMVMTETALEVGLLDWWAGRVDERAGSVTHLFTLVYALGVLTAATLNNDAAILLLTPLVVSLVRRRYPDRPDLILPFAFAVFMSAGVAALPVSNPMNMVVAEFTGIHFNDYAVHMIPVAIAGWVIAYVTLRVLFRRQISARIPAQKRAHAIKLDWPKVLMMVLLGCVLVAYPVFGFLGGPVWAVASCGAIMSLVLLRTARNKNPVRAVVEGVSWGTLAFLFAVLVISMGLFEVGLVDRLQGLYAGSDVWTVGATSAVGSALLNNHPMSHLNMMALETIEASDVSVFAALVGGDLGPRLLPMGSLAGLLWIEMLRRQDVGIKISMFVKVGVLVCVPTMLASLAMLAAY